MDYETSLEIQATLYNLALIKVAVDFGVDKNEFSIYTYSPGYTNDPAPGNFFIALQNLFEIVEVFGEYDDEVEKEKKYWFRVANVEDEEDFYVDSYVCFVVMDDRIKEFKPFSVYADDYGSYGGTGEVFPLEKGALVICDMGWNGDMDYLQVLLSLTKLLKE